MDNPSLMLLCWIVFLPAVGALMLAFFPKDKPDTMRYFSLGITFLVLIPALWMALPGTDVRQFNVDLGTMQNVFSIQWIPSFDIEFFMGLDGISFPLVVLTAVICTLAMAASWTIKKHVKAYCILFLLLEMGMLGVFMSLDFFLFYVFWEVMLLPMYFLIGVWGGPRKEYAAIKFFLFTLVGSVLMLIAILMLYFAGDLTGLTDSQLAEAHVADSYIASLGGSLSGKEEAAAAIQMLKEDIASGNRSRHTFNILALQQMGQHTDLFNAPLLFGWPLQWWAFLLLFIGFAIKVPSVPLHTWLPDAHVEAPTPISMILAGVLLKMGGYGIIRICYPICPHGGYDLAWLVCTVGVVSMVYGAFAAMAQKDFKRLVAYSSVSHMGYVVLGLGVWSVGYGNNYNSDYWNMGVSGAMFQMIAHGISSAGMFFMVGVIYDRVHHRNLDQFGGLFDKMPVYTALSIGIFFAGLGLPGLCGFIGEVLVVLSVWNYWPMLAIISASVVILTAAYILWTVQRVFLGPEYKGPHEEEIKPITPREFSIALPIFALAIVLGVFPYQTVLRYMDKTIDRQVEQLADFTEREKKGVPPDTPPESEEPSDVPDEPAPMPQPEDTMQKDADGSNEISQTATAHAASDAAAARLAEVSPRSPHRSTDRQERSRP